MPQKSSHHSGHSGNSGLDASRHGRRNELSSVDYIKARALRTEELTQRALRFNFQLAIDLREIIQTEFDWLEKLSIDPRSSVSEIKRAMIELSNKIILEMVKQNDVQKKIAEAYLAVLTEATKIQKQVMTEMDADVRMGGRNVDGTRQLDDVVDVIKSAAEYWISLPESGHKKLLELKKEIPRDSMNLKEMFEHLETQLRICHRSSAHPLAGNLSISKGFVKLNIEGK